MQMAGKKKPPCGAVFFVNLGLRPGLLFSLDTLAWVKIIRLFAIEQA